MRRLRVALLGCGTVGAGFVRLAKAQRRRIAARHGVELDIGRILVRDPARERPGVDPALLTTCPTEAIDGDCDVVVELVGGVHSAGLYVRRALAQRRRVVTANKALLATHGRELFAAAARQGTSIGFEASVCGAIPIVRALRDGLAGDSIESIGGILNGTSNFILTRMEDGLSFDEALIEAQARGFTEADASLDVDGTDAAQKLRILAGLAFEAPIRQVSVTGIRGVTAARTAKGVVRLVAEASRVAGGIALVVEPRVIRFGHPLAAVREENNAVVIRGRAAGELLLVGRGAGAMPTAVAVMSDVLER
ncbi:MAG TPA: homoserine dehydrogenase [Thermoanaerobaculia bacterium]|jgi:homoserine dehydrogenase|nr:homoserine dehydrogenase [Thermoanaerobaculia bacterium]